MAGLLDGCSMGRKDSRSYQWAKFGFLGLVLLTRGGLKFFFFMDAIFFRWGLLCFFEV